MYRCGRGEGDDGDETEDDGGNDSSGNDRDDGDDDCVSTGFEGQLQDNLSSMQSAKGV